MLTAAVDTYLAARRAVGWKLRDHEGILHDFAAFASAKGDTHVRRGTVLVWVGRGNNSPLRNCVRLRTVVRFARYVHVENARLFNAEQQRVLELAAISRVSQALVASLASH